MPLAEELVLFILGLPWAGLHVSQQNWNVVSVVFRSSRKSLTEMHNLEHVSMCCCSSAAPQSIWDFNNFYFSSLSCVNWGQSENNSGCCKFNLQFNCLAFLKILIAFYNYSHFYRMHHSVNSWTYFYILLLYLTFLLAFDYITCTQPLKCR